MKKQEKTHTDSKIPAQGKEKKAPPSPAANYKIHLRNPEDVRRLLSITVNELRRGTRDVNICRAIIYAAATLINVFQTCQLEERLAKLESMINRK